MINTSVIVGGRSVLPVQDQLVDLQTRLAALAARQQNQADGGNGAVAYQPKLLWFQARVACFKAELGQLFRLVDEEKIAAEACRRTFGEGMVLPDERSRQAVCGDVH